jgi:hypothetical protein
MNKEKFSFIDYLCIGSIVTTLACLIAVCYGVCTELKNESMAQKILYERPTMKSYDFVVPVQTVEAVTVKVAVSVVYEPTKHSADFDLANIRGGVCQGYMTYAHEYGFTYNDLKDRDKLIKLHSSASQHAMDFLMANGIKVYAIEAHVGTHNL